MSTVKTYTYKQGKPMHPDLKKGEGIKLQGHNGTFYVAFTKARRGEVFYYLESEQLGDEAPMVVVNQSKKIVMEDYR